MYVTPQEINTHLYGEQLTAISGSSTEDLTRAIHAAIAEARGYLTAWNVDEELSKSPGANPDTRNPLLVIYIKDIAVWHYINKCNVDTSLELRRDRYGRAVDWLKEVQRGAVNPGLPAMPEAERTGVVIFSSNPKRNNHF
ncbi:MAG: hypothetical protein BWY89_00046 [Bacteroidetes bacterium ADurb.BinA012]|jgi:phage gp36-like protein|nr:MAG: hypothetical protein BWY89_00046 [Bacteroidetes bacterium ADurb.BinA012]